MYKEEDHDTKGLTFGAKAAWVVVAIVFLFMFLPALAPRSKPAESIPKKHVITVPMKCYSDNLVEGEQADSPSRPVFICDPPVSLNNPSTPK